jgi:hypothetical protein
MRGSERGRARRGLVVAVVTIVGATSIAPRAAHAGEPSPAELTAARELFAHGIELEEKSDWAGALADFERVATVKISASVRFHLGLCLEHLGRGVEALDQFERAAEMSASAADEEGKLLHERAAAHVTALRKSLPVARITAPSGAGLALDGHAISPAIAAAGVRVDPGRHEITVTADGHAPARREIDVSTDASPLEITTEVGPPLSPEPLPPTRTELRDGWVPWVSGGVAVVALGGAGVFYALRGSTISDLDAVCGASRTSCPESARSTYDRGRTYASIGNVLLGVGTTAAVFGISWFALGPRAPVSTSGGLGSVVVVVRF